MVFKKKNIPETVPSETKILKKSGQIPVNTLIAEQMFFAKK
jgi:hypothetical protein